METDLLKQNEEDLTRLLTYAGFILVAFELVKGLIVKPIKLFYWNTTFGEGLPFKSYEEDVMTRHKNEFEACLLYLRDFVEAIDNEDLLTIQKLRKHRNELAHNLPNLIYKLDMEENLKLLERVDKTLSRLSNYNTYIEIGADPQFKNKGIDWSTIKGHEYLLFEEIVRKTRVLSESKTHNHALSADR